jgi:hypothetical protein
MSLQDTSLRVAQPGLRARKRLRTQRAIREAALTLFTEQGYEETTVEQIAEKLLPALWEAVVRRPPEESDFLAVKNAIKHVWLVEFDKELTARLAKIIALSPPLRRLSQDIGRGWVIGVAKALALRRGNDRPPEEFTLRARVALAVFSHAVGVWIADNCAADLGDVIEEQYDQFTNILEDL